MTSGGQKPAEHYSSSSYLTPQRLSSVGCQLAICNDLQADSFLEIGPGYGLLAWLLRRTGRSIHTIDINLQLAPSVVGCLPLLPFLTGSVDVTLCFQVLEHLPFEVFPDALKELKRVSRKAVVISLPNTTKEASMGPPLGWRKRLKSGFYGLFGFPEHWDYSRKPMSSEHLWEVGHGGIDSVDVFRIAATCSLATVKDFRNPLFQHHHFFVFHKLRGGEGGRSHCDHAHGSQLQVDG